MQSDGFNTYNPSTSNQYPLSANLPNSSSYQQQQSNMFFNSGMTSVSVMDDLVKEYLLFRGFNSCLKTLEQDLKQDKDKWLKADKVIEHIFSYIYSFDLNGLLDYWLYLDTKYFSRLTLKFVQNSSSALSLTRKYELFLLRYYLIHAIQSSKTEKAIELFENYAHKLQSQNEWKEWYCLPFLKNPEDNPTFSSIQYPRLLNYDEELLNSNDRQYYCPKTPNQFKGNVFNFEQDFLQNELNDEFQLLQNDEESKPNYSIISLIKNFTYKSKSGLNSGSIANLDQNLSTGEQKLARFGSQNQGDQSNKLLPLISRKLTIDSCGLKTAQKTSYSRSNTVVASRTFFNEQDELKKSTYEDIATRSISIKETVSDHPDLETRANPYLMLSQEDYNEHKFSIINCKFSKDGKYVASVDVQGIIKIWSIENVTSNTLMQKTMILTIEWDKRNNKILYFGTQNSMVKVYDVVQKKIIQEVLFNKTYPIITSINSLSANGKLLIMMTSKVSPTTQDTARGSQMAICNTNSASNSLIIEKIIDFDFFYSQCSVILSENYFVIGCSDGMIRVFDQEDEKICSELKAHDTSVLNIIPSRDGAKLFTISANNSIKVLEFDSLAVKIREVNSIDIKQNSDAFQSDLASKVLNNGTFMAFDNSDNFFFLKNKNGAYLHEIIKSETNGDGLYSESFDKAYELENATTIELWKASTSCILLIGSSSGTIRIFKLLHQL